MGPEKGVRLSVIVLTRNEEANVEDAVRSLLAPGVEVVVVDSASADRTVEIVARLAREAGADRVRLLASERDITIGEARNLGISMARAPHVAFVSADATAAPGWVEAALAALEDADIVYGRQEHAPPRLTVHAIVRGLRYHHFSDDDGGEPERFASNVNAAIRRHVFDRLGYVESGPASALDDILFTHEAKRLGFRVAYAPRMLVRHKDATSFRGELAKCRREGYGWGLLSPRVGLHRLPLAWGAALFAMAALVAAAPAPPYAALLLVGIYAPTLRRALRAGGSFVRRAPGRLAGAVLVGPVFDLAFLAHYLRGLAARDARITGVRR